MYTHTYVTMLHVYIYYNAACTLLHCILHYMYVYFNTVTQVNRKMAAQAMLQAAAEEEVPTGETSNKKRKTLPNVLEDNRFKAMFEDPSFAVDEAADEYKFHHPNAGKAPSYKC